ncbi:MAG: PH-like domain-containing protein, partial [Mycetocola sp.]
SWSVLERLIPGLIVVAVLVLIIGLMIWGWKARGRRGAPLAAQLAPVPESLTDPLTVSTFYVATTTHGDPLDRVSIPGLGFRAKAQLSVAPEGVIIAATGEPQVFIPAAQIRGSQQATWTIDRVVEDGGLTVITWQLGDTVLDSHFRVETAAEQHTIINRTLALQGTVPSTSESDTAS